MGRKTDVLLRGFRAAKCLTLLKLATARIKVLRNKRSTSAKQMRGEIAQLLKSGQDAHVYITKVDALIKQENMVAFYDIIDQYCHAIISRFPMIELQSNCPIDMKEPIASLIFAAPRCVELSEFASIKDAFTAKYGKEFAAAASELRPDCGVNKQVIELLSTRPATGDMKLKIMKEICVENHVNWTPGEALAEPSTSRPAGSSQEPVKTKVEAIKVSGYAGSSKATLVEAASLRVSEAGPSNLNAGTKSALQGGSNHEGIVKPGFIGAEPLKHGAPATDASKSSGVKLGLSPEKDAGKASASVFQSLKGSVHTEIPSVKSGLAAAGSLKTGDGPVFAANAFKKNDTKDTKEEGVGGAGLTALQSLKGGINTGTPSAIGTSSAIGGSFKESKGESVTKAEAYVQPAVDAQAGMSDSDDDSFVSVEEGRFEDDAEGSLRGAARRESFGKNSLQPPVVEADVNGPSLTKQPSRETQENSSSTERLHEGVYSKASSKKSSFTMESSQEEMFLKASSKNSLNTEALQEEKPFRAESRKNSLREEKSTSLTMEISHEDTFHRASSKNSSITDTLLEEKALRADSRKSSLREKKLAEEQSFKQVCENSLMEDQLKEEQHFDVSVKEDVRRKDSPDNAALRTTESSVPQMPVEYPFEEWQNRMATEDGLQGKGIIEDTSLVATISESSLEENLVEMKKIESAYGISAEEMLSGPGEEASLNIKKSPESVSKQTDDVPSSGKGVQESVGSASLGAIAPPDDFAAAAKAIAAEAARLAVLDYAKRIAGSSAIPVDLTDLANFGLDFEGIPKGSQETKKLHSEGKSVLADSPDVRQGGDNTFAVIQEEASKVEIAVNDDEGINRDHEKFDEMGHIRDANAENSMRSKMPKADIGVNGINADSNTLGRASTLTKDESLEQPDMASGKDDINPFAMGMDKAMNSLFSETGEDDNSTWVNKTGEDDNSTWVNKTEPESMSKASSFGQEEDHLDIFFKRKTPRFDEDGYSFVKVNPSFLEERVPYLGYDKKESIPQNNFFASTPVFDSFPERQSMLVEESSGSFKRPVFDDGRPEAYDASFSFDDGLDKGTLSVGLSDRKRPQSPPNDKAFASFDPEPEPSFDKVADEEEQSSIEKRGSAQVGQLKWQSKKPTKASEQVTSGETLASDTSLGGASNPLSRRSRKQPQRIDEYEVTSFTDEGLTNQRPQGSFSTLMQQQQKDQGKKDKYDAAGKGNLRTKPAESFSYSSDAMNKRVSNQHKYDFSKEESKPDRWDSTSSVEDRFSSIRTTKSPTRSSQRQKVPLDESDEDFYFAEEIGNSSAGSSVSRRRTKSPTRPLPQGYNDDAEGYEFSNKPSKVPNYSQQDLVDDDSTMEEPVPRYKPFKQNDDLSKGTGGSSAMYRQKPHRQQEDYRSETGHTEYVQVTGVGKSNPTSRLPARRKKQQGDDPGQSSSSRPLSSRTEIDDEEPHLASRYKPSAQVEDVGRVSSSPLSGRRQRYQLPQEEEQEASMEQYEQEEFYSMPLPDWRQGMGHKEKKHMPRPVYGQRQEKENSDSSSEDYEQRQQEQRRPSMFSEQEKQRRRLPAYGQEKQHRPVPLLQECDEEERMSRPLYGRKQDLRTEKENSHSIMVDYEQQQEQWRYSMLHEQEQDGHKKIHQPLPPYRQEKQHRPSPPLYDQEEEFHSTDLSRPLHRRKQDLRLEKESSDLSIEDYEQQRRSSMLSEQEQGGQEKQHRQSSPYGQEKQRRPLPPLQPSEQEEEKEEFYSMRLPDWRREERRKEKELMSRPLYGQKQDLRPEKGNVDLSIEDYEQQQEEQRRTSMWFEQDQDGQEQQRQPSPPYGRRLDLKPGKEDSENWQQEKIRQERQQLSSDHHEQQSLAEEVVKKQQQGREKERLPSPTYTRQQERQEKKKSSELLMEHYELQKEEPLHHSTALPEGKLEQHRQGNEKRPWQESKLEKESLDMQQDKPTSGLKQQSPAKEEGVKGQQERSEIKEHLPARQSLSKDEGVKGSQEKPEIKVQAPARRPPSLPAQSTSCPLESSISDPVILATIPPPAKKPVVQPVPAATTLESSVSAPPSTSVPEVKGPKLTAQKLPNVEDLLPNFEAFRRARKGE